MNPNIKIKMIEVSRYVRVAVIKDGRNTFANMLETAFIADGKLPLLNMGLEIHFKPDKDGKRVATLAWEDKRYRFVGSHMVNDCVVAKFIPNGVLIR